MCDVAILAQAEARLSITTVICHCGSSTMSFTTVENVKTYGPLAVLNDKSYLKPEQARYVLEESNIKAEILYRDGWGICLGSTCRRQCRHAVSDRPCPSA